MMPTPRLWSSFVVPTHAPIVDWPSTGRQVNGPIGVAAFMPRNTDTSVAVGRQKTHAQASVQHTSFVRPATEREHARAEQRHVERIRSLVQDRPHVRARLELAKRGPVLADHLRGGPELLETVAERLPGALAVLVVRTAGRPPEVLGLRLLLGE